MNVLLHDIIVSAYDNKGNVIYNRMGTYSLPDMVDIINTIRNDNDLIVRVTCDIALSPKRQVIPYSVN
jgi:hypothetical protein